MALKKLCEVCEEPLTGKQRMFCSGRCQRKYSRLRLSGKVADLTENYGKPSENATDLSAFLRQSSGLENKHKWTLLFEVHFASNEWRSEFNLMLLNMGVRRQIKALLEAFLRQQNPNWLIIAVDVTGRYTGDFKWPPE